MKTYRNDKSRRKHSDAAGSVPKRVVTTAQESKHVQYSIRTRSSSQKGDTPKQNNNEPNINIKTLSQTAHCKKRSDRSSSAKKRLRSNSRVRSTSAQSSASSSGKYTRQRKRMDNSSDDEEVTIQSDSDSSGGSEENVNGEKNKREAIIVRGQNSLSNASTPAKRSASGRGRYIRQLKLSDDSSDEEVVNIQADSHVKNIEKKKKQRVGYLVHSHGQGILEDGSTSAKPSALSSGKHIKQSERKRMDNSSDDEAVSIQTESDSFGDAVKNIKREKTNGGEGNIVHGDDQDVLEDDSASSKSNAARCGNYIRQRKRKRSSSDEEEVSIQTDSVLFGGTAKNIKKKRRLNGVESCEKVLADYFTSLKSSASDSGKYVRKRSGDLSDDEAVSIQTESDSFGDAVKNIKREKKNEGGGNKVHGDDQDVLENDSTSSKSNASGIEHYIRQRKRKRSSSDEEEVKIPTDSDLFGGTAKNIKKKRRLNSVEGRNNVLAEYFTSLKSSASDREKYVRKRSGESSDEEDVSIQADSDLADDAVENIKKEKKGGMIVHGDSHNILSNASTVIKPSASDSGKYIRQRKRSDDSSDEEQIIIQHQNLQTNLVDGDSQNILPDGTKRGKLLSDFDFMRERKKAANVQRRKRKRGCDSYEIDALIELLAQMKQAAIQDRQLNLDGKPATKKIAILHTVMKQLIKKDLQHTLLSLNVLHVLAEWITPLPNKALPCLQIRESILKLLIDFPTIDKLYLKESGIGKAVMYLYKHPSEIKANRKRASVLITGWCRSVYNISANYNGMSLEERRQHDQQHLPKQQPKPSPQAVVPSKANERSEDDFWLIDTNNNTIRPGEKGWISRARVPIPSNKVYIVRPQSKIETSPNSEAKKQPNRYETYLKKFNYNKRKSTAQSPVYLSIEGRKCCDY